MAVEVVLRVVDVTAPAAVTHENKVSAEILCALAAAVHEDGVGKHCPSPGVAIEHLPGLCDGVGESILARVVGDTPHGGTEDSARNFVGERGVDLQAVHVGLRERTHGDLEGRGAF
jgi:hypothetical protein